jgi:hypothetical protein
MDIRKTTSPPTSDSIYSHTRNNEGIEPNADFYGTLSASAITILIDAERRLKRKM